MKNQITERALLAHGHTCWGLLCGSIAYEVTRLRNQFCIAVAAHVGKLTVRHSLRLLAFPERSFGGHEA
jgi:hypothetical protein